MAKLRRLAGLAAAGQLDSQQEHRFRTLAERAVRALPVVEKIDLLRPADAVLAAGLIRVSP
jgi:hypothetical protein